MIGNIIWENLNLDDESDQIFTTRFDLDMNGIIQKFFQPNDEGTEISEKEMLDNLFQYLEVRMFLTIDFCGDLT